ncbi:MAG: hypothetical protein ACLT0Y_00485 [Christensenellales bacterium]
MVLGQCKAETFAELYDGVRAIDWRHLPKDAAFTVTGKSALQTGQRKGCAVYQQESDCGCNDAGPWIRKMPGNGTGV